MRLFVQAHIATLSYHTEQKKNVLQFTRYNPQLIVHPSEQISIGYAFFPDPNLDTERPIVLAAQVFYHDELSNNFTSYFYNETIVMIEPTDSIDIQL